MIAKLSSSKLSGPPLSLATGGGDEDEEHKEQARSPANICFIITCLFFFHRSKVQSAEMVLLPVKTQISLISCMVFSDESIESYESRWMVSAIQICPVWRRLVANRKSTSYILKARNNFLFVALVFVTNISSFEWTDPQQTKTYRANDIKKNKRPTDTKYQSQTTICLWTGQTSASKVRRESIGEPHTKA